MKKATVVAVIATLLLAVGYFRKQERRPQILRCDGFWYGPDHREWVCNSDIIGHFDPATGEFFPGATNPEWSAHLAD